MGTITLNDIIKSIMHRFIKKLYHYDPANQSYRIKAHMEYISVEEMDKHMNEAIEHG